MSATKMYSEKLITKSFFPSTFLNVEKIHP
jgi:hypothetical protein